MRRCTIVIIALLIGQVASAKLILRIPDPQKRRLQVEYRIEVTPDRSGKKFEVFPDDGFTFASDTLSVISVKEHKTGQDLLWSLVPAPNDPNRRALRISYPTPSPSEAFQVDLAVESETNQVVTDETGKITIQYETSHDTQLVVPSNYYLVACNYRVTLSEENGQLIAIVKGGERSVITFSLRHCK